MGWKPGRLTNFLVEGIGELIFEAIVISGPLWLIEHFFGPIHVADWVSTAVPIGFAVLGLIIFVAIGVSRHPEAYKVRIFGAVVAGLFAVVVLAGVVSQHHQGAAARATGSRP